MQHAGCYKVAKRRVFLDQFRAQGISRFATPSNQEDLRLLHLGLHCFFARACSNLCINQCNGFVPIFAVNRLGHVILPTHGLHLFGNGIFEGLLGSLGVPCSINDLGKRRVHFHWMTDPLHHAFLDNECGGNAALPGSLHVRLVRGTIGISGQRVASLLLPFVLFQERSNRLYFFVTDSNNHHALALHVFRKFGEVRHALPAGRAPGGPKFNHIHLAGFKERGLLAAHEIGDLWDRRFGADGEGERGWSGWCCRCSLSSSRRLRDDRGEKNMQHWVSPFEVSVDPSLAGWCAGWRCWRCWRNRCTSRRHWSARCTRCSRTTWSACAAWAHRAARTAWSARSTFHAHRLHHFALHCLSERGVGFFDGLELTVHDFLRGRSGGGLDRCTHGFAHHVGHHGHLRAFVPLHAG